MDNLILKKKANFLNKKLKINKVTASYLKKHCGFTDQEIKTMLNDGLIVEIKENCCYSCLRKIFPDNLTNYIEQGCIYCGYVEDDEDTQYIEISYFKYNK